MSGNKKKKNRKNTPSYTIKTKLKIAFEFANEGLKFAPENVKLLTRKAQALDGLGELEQGKEVIDNALDLDKSNK